MTIKEKILNKERSWTDILPLVLIQAYLWMQLGGFLSMKVLLTEKWGYLFSDNDMIATDIGSYISSIGFCISIMVSLLIFKKNRKLLKPLRPGKVSKIFTGAAIGAAAGVVLNGIIVAGAVLTGGLKLTIGSFELLPIIGYLAAILFQAGGEELICRTFIMGKLRRRYKSPAVAILGNSLLFTVLHLGNIGITAVSVINILIVSVMFSLIVYYTDNMWISIGLHTAWNYTQTVIFGLPNSGETPAFSIMKIGKTTDCFFFDTGFGVEGSLAALVVFGLIIAALILINKRGSVQKLKMIESVS